MAENEPHYQTRPYTLDPNREIPDDAAPAAGQTEDDAELVKDLNENLSDTVEEEAKAEQKRQEERDESGNPTPSQFVRGARSKDEGERLDKEAEKEQKESTQSKPQSKEQHAKSEKK